MQPETRTRDHLHNERGGVTWVVIRVILLLVVVAVVGYTIYNHANRIDVPQEFATDTEHFKYGSIGSDSLQGGSTGLPYWIWRAMPKVCSHLLPGGLSSLGLIVEPGMDRPIGVSKRQSGVFESIGLNCAVCHTASVRESPDAEPQTYLAASSHQLNLWGYFNFLFTCGGSDQFNVQNVMAAINNMTDLSLFERIFYRFAITSVKEALIEQRQVLAWILERPEWGPGRVDTFNPYKSLIFELDMSQDTTIGTADFMTIWDQALRQGYGVHWDGNNSSVDERNLSAAIGAGARYTTLDFPRINRIKDWIWNLKAPAYPYRIDWDLAEAGKRVYYEARCNSCHDPDGTYIGQVVPNNRLGTDPERSDAFDQTMADYMNTIGEGYSWQFKQFRTTNGYVNTPLDGVWLRGPFLHNGSVPTLRDLLNEPSQRPKVFYKGHDLFDQANVGFVSNLPSGNGRNFFRFDTSERGNDNGGHTYGTGLSDAQKKALVEYMKTL